MSYSAIRPGTPCEKRYFYRQGAGLGFVLSLSLAALLLGFSSLV
jgi:hypothetical protein